MARNTLRVQIIDALVDSLAVSSMIGASLVAPNAIQVVGQVYLRHQDKRQRNRELQSVLRYMQRQALVEIAEEGDTCTVSITEKGRQRLAKFQFDNMTIPPPPSWDGMWRIVMFDVPEKHAAARRALAAKLRAAGFRLLQKSVWVHPFDCREQIELIKYVYPEAGPYIVFIETTSIDSHNKLLQDFRHLLT